MHMGLSYMHMIQSLKLRMYVQHKYNGQRIKGYVDLVKLLNLVNSYTLDLCLKAILHRCLPVYLVSYLMHCDTSGMSVASM